MGPDADLGLGRRHGAVRAAADGDRRAHVAHGRGEERRPRDRPRLGRRAHRDRGGEARRERPRRRPRSEPGQPRAREAGRRGRGVDGGALDRAGRRVRRLDGRYCGTRGAVALSHQAELPAARHRHLGAGARPAGAQLAAARRGAQDRGDRPYQRPCLAPLLRRQGEGQPDRRRSHRFRRQQQKGVPLDGRENGQVAPRQLLSVTDGIFLTVGMILGALIFKAPSTVAGATSSTAMFLFAWLLGGLASLCGALVYAELASRYPETGGEYAFLRGGLGRGVAFVFGWARMTVIQTGAIAAVGFVFGDYASEILRLGEKSSAIWCALAVVVLTALNLAGTLQAKWLQKAMETVLIAGLVLFSVAAKSTRPAIRTV